MISGNMPGIMKWLRIIGMPRSTQSRNAAKVRFQNPTRWRRIGALETAVVNGGTASVSGTVPAGFRTGPVVVTGVIGTPTGVGTLGWLFNVEAVATIMAPNPSKVATHQISNPRTGTM